MMVLFLRGLSVLSASAVNQNLTHLHQVSSVKTPSVAEARLLGQGGRPNPPRPATYFCAWPVAKPWSFTSTFCSRLS